MSRIIIIATLTSSSLYAVLVLGDTAPYSDDLNNPTFNEDVFIDEHPYFVHVGTCSGAILSNRWIVTAMGCVNDRQGQIYVGGESMENSEEYDFDEFVEWPQREYGNIPDITFLHLRSSLNFSEYIQPATLPNRFKHGWAVIIGKDVKNASNETSCECPRSKDHESTKEYGHESEENTVAPTLETASVEQTTSFTTTSDECVCEPEENFIMKADVYAFTDDCERECDTNGGKQFCGAEQQNFPIELNLGSPLIRGNTLIGVLSGTFKRDDGEKTYNFINIAYYHNIIWYLINSN